MKTLISPAPASASRLEVLAEEIPPEGSTGPPAPRRRLYAVVQHHLETFLADLASELTPEHWQALQHHRLQGASGALQRRVLGRY